MATPRAADRPASRDLLRFLAACGVLPLPVRHVAGLVASVLISSAALVLIGRAIRTATDDVTGIAAQDPRVAAIVYLGLAAALAIAAALRIYTGTLIGEHVGARLRKALFAAIVHRPLVWFETHPPGSVLALIVADVNTLQMVARSTLSPLVRNVLVVIGAGAMMVATSGRLSAVALIAVPVPVVAVALLSRRQTALSRAVDERTELLATRVGEAVAGIATLKMLNRERLEIRGFESVVDDTSRLARRLAGGRAVLLFVVVLLGLAALGAVFAVGRAEVVAGEITPGVLSSFVFYLLLAAGACATLGDLWGGALEAAVTAERLRRRFGDLGALAAPVEEPPVALPASPDLRFEAVSFRYPSRPDRQVLTDVSFAIAPGETVAFVGGSGAGKSTIVRLALGFEPPDRGRILIGGRDAAEIPSSSLRSLFAVVPQDPYVFAETIAENIRRGRPEADDAAVEAAAVAAAVADFARALPDGLGTVLGDRGVRLSGGQRQRIAIARALLSEAPILILDEATSALDARTEALLQWTTGGAARTTLVIAHRRATVEAADRIVVLERGRVAAIGRHDELIVGSDLYRHLFRIELEVPQVTGDADAAEASAASRPVPGSPPAATV